MCTDNANRFSVPKREILRGEIKEARDEESLIGGKAIVEICIV